MIPTRIKPSLRLRSKYRLSVWLSLAIILLWSVPLGFFIGLDANDYTGAMIGAAIVLLLNALWFLPALWLVDRYYESLFYQILEDEVIVHVGIWTHSVKHVPYRTVTNIAVKRDVFDRFLFNIGTLEIQTAGGSSAQTGAEESLAGLVDYEGIYNIVAGALHRYRGLPMGPTTGSDAPAPAPDGNLTAAMLEELQAIRVLLAAERANDGE